MLITDETLLCLAQNILVQQLNHATTYLNSACQHHAEITQLHTFAALIRLSTTTHNLPTSNTSEISNNSEKLSLLADKHLWSFLLHSSFLDRMYSHMVGRPAWTLFSRKKTLDNNDLNKVVASSHRNLRHSNHSPQNKDIQIPNRKTPKKRHNQTTQ